MKWFLLILLPTFALAAYGELINNLCYHSNLYSWDWPFSTKDGLYDYWVAFDYDPDGSYIVDQVKMDWVYYYNVSCRDDMNFDIYLTDFDDPPVFSFTILDGDYNEEDTGLTYAGRDVYRGDIPLGDDAFSVTTDNKYWLALQMDANDGVYAPCWQSVVGDTAWHKHDILGWETDENNECSYAIYGEASGIESASLGKIKALFR